MEGCEFAISNAEGFMEILARDLSLLDGENVQCVLASEDHMESLMEQLELAINEADRLETQLDNYDEILCHVRDTMETMEKKNSMNSIVNQNNQQLMGELENIVVIFATCPTFLREIASVTPFRPPWTFRWTTRRLWTTQILPALKGWPSQ